MEQPLLPSVDAGVPAFSPSRSTSLMCTFNLVKVIIGAGVMAIPRAYYLMGWVLGTTVLLLVAYLTYWTLTVLVDATDKTGAVTYVGLTQQVAGSWMAAFLQLALLLFCFGFMVVYLVVIADLLVGSPASCNGLLCEFLGITGGLWLDRGFILAVVSFGVCAPLMAFRSMARLSFMNLIGVAAITLLTLLCIVLGVAAVISSPSTTPTITTSSSSLAGSFALPLGKGTPLSSIGNTATTTPVADNGSSRATSSNSVWHPLPAWPQWAAFGRTFPDQLLGLAAVVPVFLSCYVAHQSLHPVLPLLVPYSAARMKAVLLLALGLSGSCFLAMAVGTGLAFGSGLDANVLNNLFVEGMEGLIGHRAAVAATLVVRGGYLLSLLASVLLYIFPLRTCMAELLCKMVMRAPSGPSSAAAAAAGVREAPTAAAVPRLGSLRGGTDQEEEAPSNNEEEPLLRGSSSSTGGLYKHHSEGQAQPETLPGAETAEEPLAAAAAEAVDDREAFEPMTVAFEQQWFYALTYGLLLSATLVAIGVPNIWTALSAIGDCATTVEAFIVPGVIALAIDGGVRMGCSTECGTVNGDSSQQQRSKGAWYTRLGGCNIRGWLHSGCALLVIVLGVALFLNGVLSRLLRLQ